MTPSQAAQEKPTSPRTVQRVYCESEWHEGKCPHCGREAAAATPSLDLAVDALRRITQTVYSDDAPLDSPSYSALHLEAVGMAREALARLDEGSATP